MRAPSGKVRFLYLIPPLLVLLCLTCFSLGLPSTLQGRWIQTLDTGDQQAFVFRAGSIEYDYITPGGITSNWTTKVTKSFTTSSGVNIIETDGPNTFAWHVEGNSLYLDWGVPESQLESLAADWWQTSSDIYTKY
jgi:hypothetical protein